MRVSVIGGSTVSPVEYATAEELGRELAERGHTVICGGLGGVMEAVSSGASEAGGETIGLLPTDDPADANEYVDIAVATGIGHARNVMVPMNGDAVIAVDGGPGTLSEIALSQVYERPIAGIGTHDVEGVVYVETPAEAVEYVEKAV